MSDWIRQLNYLGEAWFGIVSDVVLQSVVVVAIAWVLVLLLRNHSAALRFWVWQAAAIKLLLAAPFALAFSYFMVVLPIWPAGMPDPQPSDAVEASTAQETVQMEAGTTIHMGIANHVTHLPLLEFRTWLMFAWTFVVLVQVTQCVRRRCRLSSFVRQCQPADAFKRSRLQLLAEKLDVKRPVHLVRGDVQGPLVTGILRPTIILPNELEMEQETFDQIALHELAHVKRRDLMFVWVPELLRMLLFIHPLAYWIQWQAKLHSEMACDEMVLSVGSNRRDYAKTLLNLAAPTTEVPVENALDSCEFSPVNP